MATYVPYNPTGVIDKALFNLDAAGMANYRLTGTVNVSVSDSFTKAQYTSASPAISKDIYTSLSSGDAGWTSSQLANIDLITAGYSSFIDLHFLPAVNHSGITPAAVGTTSDINISYTYRPDWPYSGESAGGVDSNFGYVGSRGDVILNWYGFGNSGVGNDTTLSSSSFGFHSLMHEIGHSLGLAHPHASVVKGVATLTEDYTATAKLGFDKLGFQISTPLDMNKEYFSIMSYDDQLPPGSADTYAQTPMILDVIALQAAYGEGPGTSGSGDDVIEPGGKGGVAAYRTYFDTGGTDTISLVNYASGAYLNMGTSIIGARHPVGVSMSTADETAMLAQKAAPTSLRWFYGDYEFATGSAGADHIVGNALNNAIDGQAGSDRLSGQEGDDTLTGGSGNDQIDGGSGRDLAVFGGKRSGYSVVRVAGGYQVTDTNSGDGNDGSDTLTGIERVKFADTRLALDLDGNAGTVAKVLGAVVGPTGVAVKAFVGLGLEMLDGGMSRADLIIAALAAVGVTASNHVAETRLLWSNLCGFNPTDAQIAPFVEMLDDGTLTPSALALLAADSPLNTTRIDLVGLTNTGLAYT